MPDVYTQVSAFVTWIWDVIWHGPQPRTTGGQQALSEPQQYRVHHRDGK